MQVIELPSLADHARALPASGPRRNRELQRLADLYAAAEAAAALQVAAARGPERDPVTAVLRAADAILGGPLGDRAAADDATRDLLRDAVTSTEFLALLPVWVRELRAVASWRPDSGACTLATAFKLWSWSVNYFTTGEGSRAPSATAAVDELAEVFCPLLAARCLVLEVTAGAEASDLPLRADLCQVQAARASALAGTACAELVFGYRKHYVWDAEGCASCYSGEELDELEGFMPGFAGTARVAADVVEADGSHPVKRGPCASFDGVDAFMRIRSRLDGCLTGARIAKDRAAAAIAALMNTTAEGKA